MSGDAPSFLQERLLSFVALFAVLAACTNSSVGGDPSGDWPAYGRTAKGDRHSPLVQITPGNVGELTIAWRYHTGELALEFATSRPTRLEATPIVIDSTMFIATPLGRVAALDASTGAELWRFDPQVDRTIAYGDFVSRGLAFWRNPGAANGEPCATRIFAGVIDGRLLSLDARTGQPCAGFGSRGSVDLRQGLRNAPDSPAEYALTSPPVVVGNTVVVGSSIADNNRTSAASGEVRGFDAVTGALRWTWDPVPQSMSDPAWKTWEGEAAHRTGGANTWSVMAADPEHDLVFLPTSSPSVDYWGGARLGDNQYANSLVALKASTGAVLWSFQTVHHDLWDFDNAAPPALVELTVGGRRVPAVIEATKSGQLFVLNRLTGVPLFEVTERAVPQSDAMGERASPTQPFSSLPALSPLRVTEDDLDTSGPARHAQCLALFRTFRNEGPFTPPSEKGTLNSPSPIGGAHWGGVAFDPASAVVVVPTNRVPWVSYLIPRDTAAATANREQSSERIGLEYARMLETPYVLRRELFSVGGQPCTKAPLGSLHAIDLSSGRTVWNVPLGTGEGMERHGFTGGGALQGMLNLGGPISTASGLVFIGATPDAYLRAFDLSSGRELWRGKLSAGARATPMTYADRSGRQFVAVAAGGDGGDLFGVSDEIVAFALPSDPPQP